MPPTLERPQGLVGRAGWSQEPRLERAGARGSCLRRGGAGPHPAPRVPAHTNRWQEAPGRRPGTGQRVVPGTGRGLERAGGREAGGARPAQGSPLWTDRLLREGPSPKASFPSCGEQEGGRAPASEEVAPLSAGWDSRLQVSSTSTVGCGRGEEASLISRTSSWRFQGHS